MEMKLTIDGLDLLRSAVAGQAQVNFTLVKIGNGGNAGFAASNLSNPLITLGIDSIEIEDNFITIRATFSNKNIDSGFRATEIGVFATDLKNDSTSILYAYGYAGEDEADYIPAAIDRILESQIDMLIYIGDAENVTAEISQSAVYVSRSTFDEFVGRRDNPFQVTASQVGLGNVPNVSTNNQTPTYSEASSLVPLKSGEKLSIAFGKIKRAISALIDHINSRGNSHGMTLSDLGAAAASHTHGVADFVSGVLSMERGGTGCGFVKKTTLSFGLEQKGELIATTRVNVWDWGAIKRVAAKFDMSGMTIDARDFTITQYPLVGVRNLPIAGNIFLKTESQTGDVSKVFTASGWNLVVRNAQTITFGTGGYLLLDVVYMADNASSPIIG